MPTRHPADNPHVVERRPRRHGRAGSWWHVTVAVLVAPFYVGLYVITAVGALLSPRNGA